MEKFTHETIIITKEAWKHLRNIDRQRGGFKPLAADQLDRIWLKIEDFRNKGANPATHPISKDEIRIDKDSFNMRFDAVKEVLAAEGYEYRQDGFIAEGFYL